MIDVTEIEVLDKLILETPALLILWGGQECGVCHAIKPRIEEMIIHDYPKTIMAYVDCHINSDMCAQKGVFTLPTVQVFFEGQRFVEEVRAFSVQQIQSGMARPYAMLFEV